MTTMGGDTFSFPLHLIIGKKRSKKVKRLRKLENYSRYRYSFTSTFDLIKFILYSEFTFLLNVQFQLFSRSKIKIIIKHLFLSLSCHLLLGIIVV